MQQQYTEVPDDILTGKDLDYLSDMFQWNYGALKKANQGTNMVADVELKEMLEKAVDLFDDNLSNILNILQNIGGEENE